METYYEEVGALLPRVGAGQEKARGPSCWSGWLLAALRGPRSPASA